MANSTTDYIEDNSLLEVYFEYIKKHFPKIIEIERIGDSNGVENFGFYTLLNTKSQKFCLAGTNVPIYNDKRQKNIHKRRTNSLIFLFLSHLPQINQLVLDKMFRDINNNNLLESEYLVLTDINEIVKNLS